MKRWVFIVGIALIIVARAFLININSAEWGDSYRILRASEFVRNFSYPTDEKRPPLFSILLAIRPVSVDAVLWGRLFMLAISFASLLVFYKLCQKLLSAQKRRALALIFLFLNPVYLYWSLRIYADVPFGLLVMVCFYVFELWREKQTGGDRRSIVYPAVMGFLCGLGILTRFEGYLLTLSALIGLVVVIHVNKKPTDSCTHAIVKQVAVFALTAGCVILPWLIYRNPLTSSYFEETSGRKYNLEMLVTYLVSYLFVLGIIPAGSVIAAYLFKRRSIGLPSAIKKYPHIAAFILLESALILAWPAAVPRLFVPIIPFLVIAFVYSWWNNREGATVQIMGAAGIALIAVYVVAQNHLRLQFLGPHTIVFVFVSAVSVVGTALMVLDRRKLFTLLALGSMLALSASTIYLHKDVYRSIKEISQSAAADPPMQAGGKIIHNDTAGIVNWYLPKSDYKNLDDKKYLTQDYLDQNNVDYIILTNEFNPDLEIDLRKRPYLELSKESSYQRGGKMFFTWLLKVQRGT